MMPRKLTRVAQIKRNHDKAIYDAEAAHVRSRHDIEVTYQRQVQQARTKRVDWRASVVLSILASGVEWRDGWEEGIGYWCDIGDKHRFGSRYRRLDNLIGRLEEDGLIDAEVEVEKGYREQSLIVLTEYGSEVVEAMRQSVTSTHDHG